MMSEKRFECVFKEHETNNCWSMIKDNQLDKPLYIRDVVDLLNELNEENQELKRLIKKMGELGGFNKHLIKTICEDLE